MSTLISPPTPWATSRASPFSSRDGLGIRFRIDTLRHLLQSGALSDCPVRITYQVAGLEEPISRTFSRITEVEFVFGTLTIVGTPTDEKNGIIEVTNLTSFDFFVTPLPRD